METDNNENSSQPAPSSPKRSTHSRLRPESSTTLMDHGLPQFVPEVIHPHPISNRPTIEQNMAFAALQQLQQELNNIASTTNNSQDQSNTET